MSYYVGIDVGGTFTAVCVGTGAGGVAGHERLIPGGARELAPDLYVSLSSDLVPVIKEYERMATTVVNAYLGPVVRAYVAGMSGDLKTSGFRKEFFLLHSLGGGIRPEEAGGRATQA